MNAAWPLGVDMLEWKKAEAFYKEHRGKLASFLCPEEVTYVKSSRKPHESLAMILSAKEAVFKTLDLPWMGISGFESIQILPSKKWYSFRLKKPLQKKITREIPLAISFIKNRSHIIAYCHPRAQALEPIPCAGI
jgi:phosphopantetheinyl transferase (holo-ACP synthase)